MRDDLDMRQVRDEERRRELGEFLRSRRERLTPASGALSGQRRRTPGLRREEVATLAGIGTAWYTWLEQGRDIKPSETALRQIARALQLNQIEKKYLLQLALERPTSRSHEAVTPALASLVNAIVIPAYLVGQRWDLLGYNDAADALFGFEYTRERNLLRAMFTPQAKAMSHDWEQVARRMVALFRFQNAGLLKSSWIMQLVDELRERSDEFRDWWAEQVVCEAPSLRWGVTHPLAGPLSLDILSLHVPGHPHLKLETCVISGADAAQRLAELLRRRDDQRSSAGSLSPPGG